MKKIGIVCEYNPFHNGHLYHLKKIKELFPDSIIILVLNGYFLQRGELSIISKTDKTKIALNNGIDIVLELPFVFGTQSADVFASTSIKILESFKCDYVVFGSECNDLKILNKITDYIINNSDAYNKEVKSYLSEGLNYPTALAEALHTNFEFKPNDLLGISYIKAIKLNQYKIKPLTIKRTNDYLDTTSNDLVISATNIRNKLFNDIDIKKYVPNNITQCINKINLNDFFLFIKYKIITDKDLSIYLDVDEGIENRLKKVIYECNNIEELILKTKSKRYTYNKIRRMLIHILIGFTKNDNNKLSLDYIKILGFNKNGKDYINKIKKDLNMSIIPIKDSIIYIYELKASELYDLVTKPSNLQFERSNKPIFYT